LFILPSQKRSGETHEGLFIQSFLPQLIFLATSF